MNIRPFDWRDIPALHRYRNQCVYLYSSLVLTRGPLFIPGAVISVFTPASGIVTSVYNNGDSGETLLGQSVHSAGTQYARLTFLTPQHLLGSPAVPSLLENLAARMGEQGAYRLIADVDESTQVFETLRSVGFAIYTRQRVWRIDNLPPRNSTSHWKPAADLDMISVNSLYRNIVPGLVQQVEQISSDRLRGMVYRMSGDLLAYTELKYGHRGIWILPLFHPDAENLDELVADLIQNLPNRLSRPVYLCIRSYLSWLEPILEDLGAQSGPRQAVMVKHLVVTQKVLRQVTIPALEGGRPEVSAPIARSEKHL
jgi:hypothetical protein